MINLSSAERILRSGAMAGLAVAAIALVRGPGLPADTLPADPGTPAAAGVSRVATGTDAARAVVAANIFSARRAPPAVRYDPAAADPEGDVPFFEDAGDDAVPADPDPGVPTLFGTVVGPGGALALLRLDPERAEPRLYRAGERAAGWRVVKIDERSVVLTGPGGRIVLHLTRPGGSTR